MYLRGLWCRIDSRKYGYSLLCSLQRADCYNLQVGFEDALTVATNDRVGFYSATSLTALRKLNVPYVVDDASDPSSVQLSSQQFNESSAPFVAGQLQITVQDLRWPRTFAPYFRFCTTSGTTLVFRYYAVWSVLPTPCCRSTGHE